MLVHVKLLGALGRVVGRNHEFDISTPSEAFKALAANYPTFLEHLYQSGAAGVGYRVLIGDTDLEELELILPIKSFSPLIIVPVPTGSGGGVGRILIGAALIGGAIAAGPAGILGVSSVTIGLTGGALVASGISKLLSPTPKAPNTESTKNSFLFNGPVNTSAQGNVVPICYGRLVVGSQLISASITTAKV